MRTTYKNSPYLEIDGKTIYYRDIIHPLDFAKLYEKEKPIYTFKTKVTTKTDRPFITFLAENRKLANINENDVVTIKLCKEKREVGFITKVYKWGKIHLPENIINILKIKNHECVNVDILAKATSLAKLNKKLDLAQIVDYDKNLKIVPRAENFITIYHKQKVPITLPRFIELSPKLIELLFLIHGDGHYASKLYFVNKSPELHNFVLEEFENMFRLPKDIWRLRVLLHDLRYSNYAKNYWKNTLNMNDSQFYSDSKSKFKTDFKGNARIIIDKTIVSMLFRYIFDKVNEEMEKENAFHALNGLLSAEGGAQIGIRGLHKITLSYNKQEKNLFKKIFHDANIEHLFKDKQNKMFVIEGWTNLYLFFKTFFFNKVIPFRIHNERRKRAFRGFLNHSFTKTMVKYLSIINKNNNATLKNLSDLLKIREDSILDTLRKEQYRNFIEIKGAGKNRNPFIVAITKEGKEFLRLIEYLENLD